MNTLTSFLERNFHTITPFDDLVLTFTTALSQRLIKSQDGDIAALGFWLRPSHLQELKKHFDCFCQNHVSRGLVFHLTASNVDTLFAYSWIVSLLCGNGNIIRLPSKQSPAIDNIIHEINILLSKKQFLKIRETNMFLHYGHQEDITKKISDYADVRVIWGSNQTVSTIRAIPINPYAKEIVFPDRFSYGVIQSKHFLKLSKDEKQILAQKLFRDIYGFDQNGCSSPRLFYWVGSKKDMLLCIDEFTNILLKEIERRGYKLPLGTFLHKLTALYVLTTELPISSVSMPINEITNVILEHFHPLCRKHPGAGLLFHIHLERLADLIENISTSDQTVCLEGFNNNSIQKLIILLNGFGPSRFIPIGEALQFSHIWDGYDLLQEFTKNIDK